MAYTINKFNGEQLIVLDDGTIDTSTSLGLVGRNYVGYGETQNENFIFLLENFANDAPPSRPLQGQIWYNNTNNLVYVYNGTTWAVVGSAVLGDIPPEEPTAGALWLRTPINTLNVWTGAAWALIGPEAVPGFGITRARSATVQDSNGDDRPVIFLEIDGAPIALCSSAAFTVNPSTPLAYFNSQILVGMNMAVNAKINGSITGNAASADKLSTGRFINNVNFDGQANITIKASTTNRLTKGEYLTGSNFDGSEPATWSVDATSANVIGKVVVRNSEGGFAAGTITANLIGNLTGDVTATGTSRFNIIEANQFIGATLTGNAFSASQLETPRKINGVNFDATQDITVTAAAGTLTGNTLNATVTTSTLTSVGTLVNLNVNDTGINVGSSGQLQLIVDGGTPTVRSITGTLNFDIGESGPDISFVNSLTSLSLGGPFEPAILGDNTTNLGITGYKFNNIYANNFLGNATTSTLSVSTANLVGGGLGAIPYQTASGVTSMLGLGAAGTVLTAQAGGVAWATVSRESLTKGSYVNLVNTANPAASLDSFTGLLAATISVDATSANTASKIVARDSSGNFAAGTVSANLSLPTSGTISWPNNQYGGSGDVARIDTYSASGEALRLRLYVENDPDDLIELNAAGGVLITRGNITSAVAPTVGSHLANKTYVDTAIANASYYDEFSTSTKSPGPQTFPQRSIRGFSAYSNTDFPGNYFGGITVTGPSGVYSGQLAFNWNSEESSPSGLYFRVNDDTSTTSEWSPWQQIATASLTFTSGNTVYSTSGFTNQVGSWNNGANFFDVFPPAGKTMTNLLAFVPSIAVIHYAGGVNGDDSMRCTWSNLGDRIRVYVQNTEQRSTPAASYLAVWS